MNINTKIIHGALYLIALLLTACGGGGSSAPTPTPTITGAPTLSASSVIQGVSITVTVPVSGAGYVGACLSPSLVSSPVMTMCNGGTVSGNSVNIPITVAANATPTSTYWVAIMTCANQAECTAGNGIAYSSYNVSTTYYSATDTQGTFVPPYTNTTYTIPQFTVISAANPSLPGMTATPTLSASSVVQGGTIGVTVPVTPVTGFVGACLSTSLTGPNTTMCGGGIPVSNSINFTINIDPAATPATTYYVWVLACANSTDCGNNTGMLYSSSNSSTTYYSATDTNGTLGTASNTGYSILQFSITSSGGGGGGGTGIIPGGITGVPVFSTPSLNPGGVINVTVPVTNDTGWVKVCTKSTQAEWMSLATNYGCGDAAVSAGSASVNVSLSNTAPLTSTYWVTLLACSTQADCTAGTGLGYSLVNLSGYSTVYYSATVTAGSLNGATLAATAYTIPYFSVIPIPVSTAFNSPTDLSVFPAGTRFEVGAGAAGYVTFWTKTGTPYGIYVTDQSNATTALVLTAYYDDGVGNPVAVVADGLKQGNMATLGLRTDATLRTYVVKIDNSTGVAPVAFTFNSTEALSGGTAFGSATALALRTPVSLGADSTNGWFSFVPDNVSATMTLSGLTHGMNVDLLDSNGSTVLTTFSSMQDLFLPQNPFISFALTQGNTYYLHVTSQSLVVGAPTIGSVSVDTP